MQMQLSGSKIAFSDAELGMVQDAQWLLTKRAIMQKLEEWLGERSNSFLSQQRQFDHPFRHVWDIPPKISKGEVYEGLPWLMLDYPRYFKADGHFAIRIFFWWGNCIAVFWHLSGIYAHALSQISINWEGWRAGIVSNPYDFTDNPLNYRGDGKLHSEFFRAEKRYALQDLPNLAINVEKDYCFIMSIMQQMH